VDIKQKALKASPLTPTPVSEALMLGAAGSLESKFISASFRPSEVGLNLAVILQLLLGGRI
jgi:hypothetical protein